MLGAAFDFSFSWEEHQDVASILTFKVFLDYGLNRPVVFVFVLLVQDHGPVVHSYRIGMGVYGYYGSVREEGGEDGSVDGG